MLHKKVSNKNYVRYTPAVLSYLFGLSAFIRIAVSGFLIESGLSILNTSSIIDGSCNGYFQYSSQQLSTYYKQPTLLPLLICKFYRCLVELRDTYRECYKPVNPLYQTI